MSCLLPIHTDYSYLQAHPFINQKYKKKKIYFGVK